MVQLLRDNIYNLRKKIICKEELLFLLGISEDELEDKVFEMLKESHEHKDAGLLEDTIYYIFLYNMQSKNFVSLLNLMIMCDWHTEHENIAMLLQKLKSPDSIDSLFETAQKQYKYLEYDDAYALAVKCIWALGDIGTEKAYERLEILSESRNVIISDNAMKQIKRIEQATT